MFYKFPANMTLDETRDVVRRHNEALDVTAFIEVDRGDFVLFNYVVSFDGSFPDLTGDPVRDREIAIIRELRGVTFDKATGEVVTRKFHKFFNVGQRAETQPHVIDWSQPHDILLKADGSMITPYKRRDGQWEWHTKMGATDVAKLADDYVAANPHYVLFAEHCRQNGLTPLFEFCSRKQKIVIDYPEDKLVLLAVRNNYDGEYLSYASLVEQGAKYGIPVIESIEGSVTDPAAFLEAVRVLTDVEGYIVRFRNGHMVKVKAEEYLRLHNLVDIMQRDKDVVSLIFSGSFDDTKPMLADDTRERAEAFAEAIERGLAASAARLQSLVDEGKALVGEDRKRFAVEYANKIENPDRSLVFQIAGGRSALDVVTDFVKKKVIMVTPEGAVLWIATGPKIDEIRHYIGNAKWDDFRDQTVVIED